MRNDAATVTRSTSVVLLATACLVYGALAASVSAAGPGQPTKSQSKGDNAAKQGIVPVETTGKALPAAVRDMLDAIMSAVHSGRIEDLSTAVDWNEMKPDLAPGGPVADPIAYWKAQSADGQGRSILAALGNLIETRPGTLAAGKDVENSRVFVWPGFADKPLAKLSPAEEVELYRLAPPAEVAAMKAKGKYAGWRLAIGADGTWHSFRKVD